MTPEPDLVMKLERTYSTDTRNSVSYLPRKVKEAMIYGVIPSEVIEYVKSNPDKKVDVNLLNDAFSFMQGVDVRNQGRFAKAILRILKVEENYVGILSSLCKEDIRKNGSIKVGKIKTRLNSPQMKNVHFVN